MDEDNKGKPESKPKRYVSKAPEPVPEIHGTWAASEGELSLLENKRGEEPVRIPDCTPFVSPEVAAPTAVIVAEARQKFPMRPQMPELCRHVIAELTPHFRDSVAAGTVKADSALSQMRGLLHELLRWNSDNSHRWMLGASAATAEYPLEQALRQSAEWLAFARAVSGAGGGAAARGVSVPPAETWAEIEITFLSDERIQVCSGDVRQTYNYAEFGFKDQKSEKPILAWAALLQLAKDNGAASRPQPAGSDGESLRRAGNEIERLEKRMQEIRKKLKNHFKIESDPISYNGHTYQTAFRIRCGASFYS